MAKKEVVSLEKNQILIEKRRSYHEEDDFYTEAEIESLLEDDEISASEEAFMRGYIDS